MKLNPNCVRDVLIELEKLPYQQSCTPSHLISILSDYTKDEIEYTCFKLADAGYITISTIKSISSSYPQIRAINDITFYGHEFLNNVRSDTVWKNVKEVGTKIGASSISALTQVATGVITAIIKNQLGI